MKTNSVFGCRSVRLSFSSKAATNISGQQGFTLLEILIALAIFSIMSMMAYAGLTAVLDARASAVPRSEQLAQLQTTLYLLNEDLSQIIKRPIRDEFGTTEPAFSVGRGNEILVLSRTVPTWSNNAGANKLLRVSYSLDKDTLFRRVWILPDRTQQTEYRSRKLITTKGVALSKFKVDTQTWEPLNSSSDIPNALDISFKLDGIGTIHRSFFIH